MADGVTVDMGSVQRAWKEMGRATVDVELRTSNCTRDQWDRALGHANDAAENSLFGGIPTPSPQGFLSLVDDAHDPAELETWLTELATLLTTEGVTGTIRGVVPPRIPEWLWAGDLYPKELTAFVAWNVDLDAVVPDPQQPAHWGVDPTDTERLSAHLANWVRPGGPNLHVARAVFNTALASEAHAGPRLASAILAADQASVVRFDDHTESARTAYLYPRGETTIQILGGDTPWHERVDELTHAIVAQVDLLRLAFIRPSGRDAQNWQAMDRALPMPGPRASRISTNFHLHDRFVPDAHGVQVLTDTHLEHARDLSDWTITDLGHRRHLVQAPDLAAWYENLTPDPHTLTKARHDFGDMILTKETIAANPPPWA